MKKQRTVQERLKAAMLAALEQKDFDKISVKELCEHAHTSRVTFYTYYDDKYALLDDFFRGLFTAASDTFEALERSENPKGDPVQSYLDFLGAVLDLRERYPGFFKRAGKTADLTLYYRYYGQVLRELETFTVKTCGRLRPKFSPEKTSAFLCNGLWGFIDCCREAGDSAEQIRKESADVLRTMMASGLFEG
jgi:AcrR family transcriptional regulator